jgi:tyrosyl-tRNA synthetase
MDVLEDLSWRGLLYQTTDAEGLRQHLTSPRSVYCGFDPTRDSLGIGNLVPMLVLRRFQLAGHRPVVVMGGGTGMIGDPSGKEAERPIQTREQVDANVRGQMRCFERVLDFSGENAARIVNNADWLEKLSYIGALRDIGKHFSVNMMIQKDSVRERLENREQGISYTEFSYMLLQAYDFLHLFDTDNVTVQAAGSDQWGNVVAGIDLIRRKRQATAYGLTAPLITKADGTKFGKSESGNVWLTAEYTSPYAFYQFWLNTQDADVVRYLKTFTLLPRAEIERLAEALEHDPGARAAQRALAEHVTELVHGREGLEQAVAATQALFSGDVANLSKATLDELFQNAPTATLPRQKLEGEGAVAVDLLVEAEVVKSKRESREFLGNGAIVFNGTTASLETRVTSAMLLHGEVLLVRRGRKNWHVLRFV